MSLAVERVKHLQSQRDTVVIARGSEDLYSEDMGRGATTTPGSGGGYPGSPLSQVPAGSVLPYAGSTVPEGWLACDGTSYNRDDYPDLYTAITTVWGSASSTTFNVPDFRGRTLIGDGTGSGLSARTLGDDGIGEETHALSSSESKPLATTAVLSGVGTTVVTGYAGGAATAHENMQPSAVIKWMIKT